MTLRILFVIALSTALSGCASIAPGPAGDPAAATGRVVAITIDDLPYVGDSLADANSATNRLLAALDRHGATATVFVEGRRVEIDGETSQRIALLRQWRDGGHALANHGFSHPSFNDLPVEDFLADVDRGQAVVERIAGNGRAARWFRAPYNHTGATPEAATALRDHLHAQRTGLAPFTIDHADWLFNSVYDDALIRGDDALARRIGDAYLAQLDRAFDFAEELARDTFGRDMPHVFLIHANRINAEHLDAMLERIAERGYRIVSLDAAVRDPAYAVDSPHATRWGYSWLHRWRADRGLPNRIAEEPEPPEWIREAFEAQPER